MTAKDLYNLILTQGLSEETCICRLHRPCMTKSICSKESQITVIDFDRVEISFHKRSKLPSSASVDALSYKQDCLLFVEIKGWKQFIAHSSKSLLFAESVKKQIEKFDLKKKLLDSISICNDLVGDPDFLMDKHPVYVIVTDIKPITEPLAFLAMSLDVLANTSSQWELVCMQLMNKNIQGISDMKTHCLSCEDFDTFYQSI